MTYVEIAKTLKEKRPPKCTRGCDDVRFAKWALWHDLVLAFADTPKDEEARAMFLTLCEVEGKDER